MSQPPIPPTDGYPVVPGPPAEPDPGMQWTAPPAPSWTQPWQPPVAPAPLAPRRPAAALSHRTALVLVALGAAVLGAVAGGAVATAAFLPSAQEIGEEVAAAAAPDLEDSVSDGISKSMEDVTGLLEDGPALDPYVPAEPEEQFPPTEPGDLGPDPVLDDYADSCFEGDMQACDDLYYEAPPLSDYEAYAWSCGGRVKAYSVQACTDLD